MKRYPVVARWRADVDYVAAGIYCFQPYCVTGELDPPANPLVQPQFCLRFNDLDSIGITGRHYSGFIMQGIQVFNTPQKWVYFKEECVEFNLDYLIKGLKVDPDEITLIEDVWAGGGNMGPSVEYFVGGLEVGNMVFMQYKTYPDGSRQELQVKVIDVGTGLERVPWLLNGSPTSYVDTFHSALERLQKATGIPYTNPMWEKFGPYSCLLNVDEVDSMEDTWKMIADTLNEDVKVLMDAIQPVKDMYLICDHTRSVLVAVEDGSLPSNTGGAANLRGILRRVFTLLHKNKWWDSLGMEGLMDLFECHRQSLGDLWQAPFKEYKSFRAIIEIEYNRWLTTDTEAKEKLDKLMKKHKNDLPLDAWVLAVTSYGIDAEKIHQLTGLPIPGSLYYEIATREEKSVKQAVGQLYETAHLVATEELFYLGHGHDLDMTANIVTVIANIEQAMAHNIVVLNRTTFYPTGGGQDHDTGVLVIDGVTYKVVDCKKVGRVNFHILENPLPGDPASYAGKSVEGRVDFARRQQLMHHHSATHIVSSAAKKVLGPHIWQNGASKTVERASLDMTHYASLTHAETVAIELEANRVISRCKDVKKYYMRKEDAESKFGFELYQGGVVPGSELRIVDIEDTDTEACCGTHVDNTGEIGSIRILSSKHISDGIVRLYFVAGERALQERLAQDEIVYSLSNSWSVTADQLVEMGGRFFDNHKRYYKLQEKAFKLEMRAFLNSDISQAFVRTEYPEAVVYASGLGKYSAELKDKKKGIVFVANSGPYIIGLLGDPSRLPLANLEALLNAGIEKAQAKGDDEKVAAILASKKGTLSSRTTINFVDKDKKRVTVEGVVEFTSDKCLVPNAIVEALKANGFVEFEI